MFPAFGKLLGTYLTCDALRNVNFWSTDKWEGGMSQQFGEGSG